jgi:hypothetical protein
MRNLLEYPVTHKEVITALDTALQQEDDDDRIGSLSPMILQAVLDFFKLEENFQLLRSRLEP